MIVIYNIKIIFIICLLVFSFICINVDIVYCSGENWLVGWSFRKSHEIKYSSGTGTGYQICIKCFYGSGLDGTGYVNGVLSGIVYLDNYSQSEFGDVRFTDNDGETLLNYWQQETVTESYSIFWVKINDDLSSANATIYLYYGNSTVSSISSGDNTFYLFDDFDSLDTVSKWSVVGGTWTTGSDSGLSVLNYSHTDNDILVSQNLSYTDIRYYSKVRFNTPSGGGSFGQLIRYNSSVNFYTQNLNYLSYHSVELSERETSWYSKASNTSFYATNNYYYSMRKSVSTTISGYIANSTFQNPEFSMSFVDSSRPYGGIGFRRGFTSSTTHLYVDFIFVAKGVGTEPLNGNWGIIEQIPFNSLWFFNEGGTFLRNGTALSNGSSLYVSGNFIYTLYGASYSTNYTFNNFTWSNYSTLSNPYDITIPENNTNVWCYFSLVSSGATQDEILESILLGCCVIGFISIFVVFVTRKQEKN